ncbi:MAG: pre-mRNA-splicing factor syf1 [Bathelium mastoideum]|nr:MAG: pre-mRNA-splicing factor syf1 [Bathelium mastoideum]
MPGELLYPMATSTEPGVVGKSCQLDSLPDAPSSSALTTARTSSSSRLLSGPSHLFLITQADLIYENDLLRNPGSIKPWIEYFNFKKSTNSSILSQAFVLERAVKTLPRSYKLWKLYLELRTSHLVPVPDDPKNKRNKNPARYAMEFQRVNTVFEQSLVLLNKMPRIWEMFLQFLIWQPLITYTRRTFDRALRALPLTQHYRIWSHYKCFAISAGSKTTLAVWARYIQIRPKDIEHYIELLVEQENYTEAVQEYMKLLNNPHFKSTQAKGPFTLWMEMLDVCIEHAKEVETSEESGIDVERIVRSGLERFGDQRGLLWVALARYWINKGDYEKARDIFEEGIKTVMTVRDFTMVFDAYAEAEEALMSLKMDDAATRQKKSRADEAADLDLDIRMARFEFLMDRRPFLVNDVLLRQNPNNVNEWAKRVALWGDNETEVDNTYATALGTVDPKKAVGKLNELWTNYAKFYQRMGHLSRAREIMETAVKVRFRNVADLVETWVQWAEMELGDQNLDRAIELLARATKAPKRSRIDYFNDDLPPQQRIHKSWKLWSFYVDLVESTSTLEETRKVYERILELRIASPGTIVNYANLLEEHGYYEDSYKVYERGLGLYPYPVAFELWNMYLSKAVDNSNVGMERLRDLFEQAIDGCPPSFAMTIYTMFGSLEENRGLVRASMRIYDRATRAVSDDDRLEMFKYYITKSASNFGLASTRPIYERALEVLPDREAKEMGLKFAEMERRLGEIDRARMIYGHTSQFADPRLDPVFWRKWEVFEVKHGNEDTFKEMLRIKRSVQAQYNTDINYIASEALARSQNQQSNGATGAPEGMEEEASVDAMAALERQARAPKGFVAASSGPQVQGNAPGAEAQQPTNPDAIDIDDDVE